jgi:hypothetical protein
MITRILTEQENKELISEIFYNRQNKVTKIDDESVINAFIFALAKLGQISQKDAALVESRTDPRIAFGQYLDEAAKLFNAPKRSTVSGSSTYLRVSADVGTQYLAATHLFQGSNGVKFELENDFTMGDFGYDFVKVRSLDTGSKTNVDANTINTVTPSPAGHLYVLNDFLATGGRDVEQDDAYRLKVIQNVNVVAKRTIAGITAIFQSINPNILRVINKGLDQDGKVVLAVVTQNGIDLNQTEIDTILDGSKDFFSISDLRQAGSLLNVSVVNSDWYNVGDTKGVDFRVQLLNDVDPDDVRKNIQIAISNYLDFRFWDENKKVEWDDLLGIVKRIGGVQYVPDQFFFPQVDETVPKNSLPRLRAFVMRDMQGNVINDSNNLLNPIYYQKKG